MREHARQYPESLGVQGLNELETLLTSELSQEIRLSPDGLTIRYPLWLINHLYHVLPDELRHRVTMIDLAGAAHQSAMRHLSRNNTVLLWLIEAMAKRYPGFRRALYERLLIILSRDNTRHLTVEFRWDPSRLSLHDDI